MFIQLFEQLPNHLTFFFLGFLFIAPLLSLILFILLAIGWYLRLPVSSKIQEDAFFQYQLNKFNEPTINEKSLKNKKSSDSLSLADSFNRSRVKRGWLRIATTPNPIPSPTMFEMMHDMVVKNWNSGTNFLSNTSAFAINLGNSLSNLKNINASSSQPSVASPVNPTTPITSTQSIKSRYSTYEESSTSTTPEDNSVFGAVSNLLNSDNPGYKHSKNSKEAHNSKSDSSQSNCEINKPNDHHKCKPSQRLAHGWHYAVLGDSTLSLYKDSTCQEILTVLNLCMYDIGLYPFNLSEGELYHTAHPILLAGHSIPVPDPINPSMSSSHEIHYSFSEPAKITKGFAPSSSNSPQNTPAAQSAKMWLPNYYIFAEMPVDKESWYEALLSRCRFPFSNSEQLKTLQEKSRSSTEEVVSNQITDKEEPFSGLSRHSLKLSKANFDLFSYQDLRTRIFGLDSLSPPNSPAKEQSSNMDSMSWFNAICGRVYLGLRDSDFLHKTLKIQFKNWSKSVTPSWLLLELENISLGPRLPCLSSLPSVSGFNNQGQLTIRFPIQHFGSLFSFRFNISIFQKSFNPAIYFKRTIFPSFLHPFLEKIIPDQMPHFFQKKFSISIHASLNNKDDSAFQTDLIATLHGLPTRNCWIGLTSLPPPSQLKMSIFFGSRLISIPVWIMRQFFYILKNSVVYPNLLPIPFFPQTLMLASETSWDSDQPLPLLIQTLTQTLTQSRNSYTANQSDKEESNRCIINNSSESSGLYKRRINTLLPMLRPLIPKLSALDLRFYTNLRGATRLLDSLGDENSLNQPPAPTVTSGTKFNGFTGGLISALQNNGLESPDLVCSRDIIPLFDSVCLRMASAAPPKSSTDMALVHLSILSPDKPSSPEKENFEDKNESPILQSSQMLQAFEAKITQQSTPDLTPSHSSRVSVYSQKSPIFPSNGLKLSRSPSGPVRCSSGWSLNRLSSLPCAELVITSATSGTNSPVSTPTRKSSLKPLNQFNSSNLQDYFVD